MNQNFSKSKTLPKSSKLSIVNGGGGGGGEGGILDLLKVSNNYHICNILDWG